MHLGYGWGGTVLALASVVCLRLLSLRADGDNAFAACDSSAYDSVPVWEMPSGMIQVRAVNLEVGGSSRVGRFELSI